MATVALLGTGFLGSGMVENLLAKGHRVRAWNRSPAKLLPLVERGAVASPTPAAACEGVDRVHLVLTADDAVDHVLHEAAEALRPEAPILDHSTNQPFRVRARVDRLRAVGLRYLHAPVFMNPSQARAGKGLMLVAGPAAEAELLTPALSEMAAKVWHVGERPDLAAIHKLSGNAVFVGLTGILGDVLAMGAEQGLGPAETLAVFEVFQPGASLPFIATRVVTAGQSPPGFDLHTARKDVRLMIEAAGGPEGLVVLPAVAQAMDAAIGRGLGEVDYAVYARGRDR